MCEELSRRSALLLFAAMALALGVGLMAAPAFDLLSLLYRLQPHLAPKALGMHALLAGCAVLVLANGLGRCHTDRVLLRSVGLPLLGLGLLAWLFSLTPQHSADARLLLWLELLPLVWAVAMLVGRVGLPVREDRPPSA